MMIRVHATMQCDRVRVCRSVAMIRTKILDNALIRHDNKNGSTGRQALCTTRRWGFAFSSCCRAQGGEQGKQSNPGTALMRTQLAPFLASLYCCLLSLCVPTVHQSLLFPPTCSADKRSSGKGSSNPVRSVSRGFPH